jgi:GH25 family lysozyme M1 (1,4-beta-N-acetylmuramidase)
VPVQGIDVASFQSLKSIEVVLPTIGFGIVKATEGSGYVNPIHVAQARTFARAGKAVGFFHFLRHDESARAQWAHFQSVIASHHGGVVFALDHEMDEGGYIPAPRLARTFIKLAHSHGYKIGRYGSEGETMRYELGEDWRWVAKWASAPPVVKFDLWQQAGSGQLDMNEWPGTTKTLHDFWRRNSYRHKPALRRRISGGAKPAQAL